MDRLDAAQVDTHRLTMTLTDTLKLYTPEGFGGAIPGSGSAIPGQQTSPDCPAGGQTVTKKEDMDDRTANQHVLTS